MCRVLPGCQHRFHALCVESWLSKSRQCPVCCTEVAGGGKSDGLVADEAATSMVVLERVGAADRCSMAITNRNFIFIYRLSIGRSTFSFNCCCHHSCRLVVATVVSSTGHRVGIDVMNARPLALVAV
ncbi:hypothetical protein QYE76_025121 [Lolium multiflorum]|uniref:Zinc finger C3HC4 RING-type domain-containing protein n=1 Tax=Lolium multiflorum TaxID=4521 RepID=A0AAD8RHD1_LOLMU|nr:hypothetical protein QYE76_025121 [Lolium multiflorum]